NGVGEPQSIGVETVEYNGHGVLHRGTGGDTCKVWQAGDLQFRSGEPIHLTTLHAHCEGRGREDIHGRQGTVDGQCFHRAALAVTEIRVCLSARIRERNGGAQWDRSLDKVLRHATPAFVARRADAGGGLWGRCALFHRREKTKKEKTATTETGGLTLMEPSLIPPPGRLTNRGHLSPSRTVPVVGYQAPLLAGAGALRLP